MTHEEGLEYDAHTHLIKLVNHMNENLDILGVNESIR